MIKFDGKKTEDLCSRSSFRYSRYQRFLQVKMQRKLYNKTAQQPFLRAKGMCNENSFRNSGEC